MLHAIAVARSARPVWWLHAARDGQHHPFAAEVRHLMLALPHAHSFVCYSKPAAVDKLGEDFDAAGHLSRSLLEEIGIPRDADVYLCGPAAFMADMKAELAAYGVPPERVHMEIFSGGEARNPGVVGAVTRNPHLPKGDTDTGPLVSFARSGVAAHWNPSAYQSILELAEACDVPVRAGAVSATTVRAVWFRERCPTHQSRSTSPLPATSSSAAHNRPVMSSSISE
jgi:ferredoxin-NADP reductase